MSIRKKAELFNLEKFKYIEIDRSPTSNKYFGIVDFPDKLTAGKNLFKIRMQNNRFVDNCKIYIDIIDFNGNAIYYEPLRYVEKDGTRVVSIYIYPDTPPGIATVNVAARLQFRTSENSFFAEDVPVPFSTDPASPDYYDIPNLLWQREVTVSPSATNTSELIFVEQPSVTITEIVQPYRQPVTLTDVFTEYSSSGSQVSVQGPPPVLSTTAKREKKTSLAPKKEVSTQGSLSRNSPAKAAGKSMVSRAQTKTSLNETAGKTTKSDTVITSTGTSILKTVNFPLSRSMQTYDLTIVNPTISVPKGTSLDVNGRALPDTQRGEVVSSLGSAGDVELSGSYVFNIQNILNSKTAKVSQVSGFKRDSDNTFGSFQVSILVDRPSKNNASDSARSTETPAAIQDPFQSQLITGFTATNVTASYIKPSVTVFTENSSSFADIIIANTEPETGDVFRVKTLFKPSGQFGDFQDLGDTILEQQNILIDENSFETNVIVGSFFENYGTFESLSEINQYWSSSKVTNQITGVTLSYDTDNLMGGVDILTNWTTATTDQYTANVTAGSVFEIQDEYKPDLFTDTTYVVQFKVGIPPDIGLYSSRDSKISTPRMDVYVKGDITRDNPVGEIKIGQPDINSNWKNTLKNNIYKDGGRLGTRIGTIFTDFTPGTITDVQFQFKGNRDEPLDLKFVTRMGRFIISDINVFADKETGFSPNYVRIAKRIPTEHMNTPLTFKFQYFDTRGLKADLETFAYGAVFDGDNVYIEGTDNLLTGSVFIGNSIGSGIELAGVSSGFIRSIGYDGFTNTAAGTSPGGFLIYSGSNSMTLGADTYEGVGLQLVGDNDNSHFIFTTQNGGSVDIKAEKFFIGTTGTQFISGSGGNIEISSSIFHLDPQENKLIIGADAIINADLSVNQLFTPAGTNKSNARSYISSSGEAGFSGDGSGNYAVELDGTGTSKIAGFTIDSAAIKSSDDVSLVLKDTGEITGSKVLLSGGRITGGVVIEGSVTANQIRTPATIAGQPSTQANASSSIDQFGFAKFTSASIAGFVVNTEEIKSPLDGNIHNLRLKASGQVTGSKVQFDGGTIGGFELSSTQINSTTNDLILKASGQVSGSKALFTGGKIGGFTMTPSQLSGGSGNTFIALIPQTGIQMGSETFSSAPFSVTNAGVLKATSGTIGGFTLGTNTLTATNFELNPSGKRITLGSGNNIFIADGDEGIQLGHATFADAPFSVDLAGRIKATEGEIGGFGISSTKITGSNIVIDSAGSIQTSDYASDLKGWKISADFNGFAEFENAKIRGTLATAVFEKETVNAVGGQLYVANSTALTASAAKPSGNYSATDATMSVKNVSGFSPDEILSLKKVSNTGFSTEYVKVVSASRNDQGSETDLSGELFLIRGYGNSFPVGPSASLGDTPGGAQSYSGSQVIVSTGKIGTGYIRLNANPNNQATPYMDIVERTGSGVYDVDLKVRLGDLKGLANSKYVFGSSSPGFGLATTNVFLQGGIIANTGSIAGIKMESSKLFIGNGVHANSNTGFYVDSGSNFSLGDKLTWDGSALVVRGQLRLESGENVQDAINEATASNTAKSLILTTDSQIFSFASASSNVASPTAITVNIAQQNLSGVITPSDITISSGSTTITGFKVASGSVTISNNLYSGISSGSLTYGSEITDGGLGSLKANLPLTISVTKDGLTDSTTIFKVEGGSSGTDGAAGAPGVDAYTVFLTNESHTFPADSAGNVSSNDLAAGATEVRMFKGTTQYTLDASSPYGTNTYRTTVGTSTIGLSGTTVNNQRKLTPTAVNADTGTAVISIIDNADNTTLTKTYSFSKADAGAAGQPGATGATGATGPNFSFLSGSLATIDTTGGLSPGLLMTSNVFGFHGSISAGDGTNATLGDFTSFLDAGGSFYLGGGASGSSTPSGGYFAWNNGDKSLLISGSNARVDVDKFFLGSTNSQFISGSNGNITISGDVDFQGLPRAGNVVYFEDWSAFQNNSNTVVSQPNAPKTDGTGIGFYPTGTSGLSDTAVKTDYAGQFTGNYLQVGNSSGNDMTWCSSNQLIPFNETSLYEYEIRVKVLQTGGSPLFYAGFTAYEKDGVTPTSITGVTSLSNAHYIAASAANKASLADWKILKGYLQGTASSGAGGLHPNITDPGFVYSDAMNGYLAPMFLCNYDGQSGTTLIDYIRVTEINNGGGSTRISGDSIKAGSIKSNNLSTGQGSEFKLDDGTFKLGGTSSPKLSWNGSTLSVEGDITVSNPGDFADPNATKTLNYNFAGNGSQTLDTGIWTLRNISGQTASTNGIRLVRGSSPSSAWEGGIRTIEEYPRSQGPTLIVDWEQMHVYANPLVGYAMVGWWTGTTSTFSNRMYYGVYIYHNSIQVRTAVTAASGIHQLADNTNSVGTKWRLKIRLKAAGGAMVELFKDGDFTTPYGSYDYGTTGTLANLGFGVCQYQAGNSDIKLEQVAIGSQPATTQISGAGISTGAIQSTNLSTTRGTKIDLDNETAQFGGTAVSYTAGTGIFLDGGTAGSPKAKIGSTTQFLKYDTTAGLQVAGDITVTNGDDFADPTAQATFNYPFGGNGSQTLDTGAGMFISDPLTSGDANGLAYGPTATGNQFKKITGTNWYIGFLTRNSFKKANAPVSTLDFKITSVSTSVTRFMAGFWRSSNSAYYTNILAGCHTQGTALIIRYWNGYSHIIDTSLTGIAVGDTFRMVIKLITGTGSGPFAEMQIFKNGDFQTPAYSNVFSGANPTATVYYGFSFSGNSTSTPQQEIQSLTIGTPAPASTVISGNGISTGAIESSTLTSTVGTQMDLDNALIKIGGTGAYTSNNGILMDGPNAKFAVGNQGGQYLRFNHATDKLEINAANFSVDSNGTVSAAAIQLTDYAKADYFIYSLVKITSGDYTDYFQTYSQSGQNYTRLVLDGSLGGDIAQSVRIEYEPPYPIGMILTPYESSPYTLLAGHEITIECGINSGILFAAGVSSESTYRYGFWGDSDDWFYDLFQTRVVNGVTYGGSSVGTIGVSTGRTIALQFGNRFKFYRSTNDFRLLGVSSYNFNHDGVRPSGAPNFYNGLKTSNGTISIGLGAGAPTTANYALHIQNTSDRNGNLTDDVFTTGKYFATGLANVSGNAYLRYSYATGQISYTTSTRKSKQNILTPSSSIYNDVLNLEPKYFEYNQSADDTQYLGFIAEEAASASAHFATYGPDMEWNDEGDHSDPVSDRMVPVDIDERAIIASLVGKIQDLEYRLKALEDQ